MAHDERHRWETRDQSTSFPFDEWWLPLRLIDQSGIRFGISLFRRQNDAIYITSGGSFYLNK